MLYISKKMAIYPVDKCNISYAIEYTYRNKEKKIHLLSYSGSGLTKKNIGYYDNKLLSDEIIECLDKEKIEQYDKIILLESENKNVTSSIIEIAILAIKYKIKVEFAFDISIKSEYALFLSEFKNGCTYHNSNKVLEELSKDNRTLLYSFSKPIIFIGGINDYTNQDEVALKLISDIKKNGYSVSLISNNSNSLLLNYYNYNKILKSEYGYGYKIKYINKLIHYVINKENCDILIVMIPGNALKYNDSLTGDFGVNHYIFSQVATPDYYIGCFMYGEYNNDLIYSINKLFKKKYGFFINAIHLSNALIDSQYEPIDSEYRTIRLAYHNDKYNNFNDIIIANLLLESDEKSLAIDRICNLI